MKQTLTLALLLLLAGSFRLSGQVQLPYILNGAATQRTCNCYILTPDQQTTSGTVWNKNKINLRQSFNYVFDVNLGCKDDNGADGIGFILQTKGTNLGATGQGIGFKGISPSLGVIIDTYQNNDENDPSFDHLAIQMDGVTDHLSSNNLAGPVTALANSNNIEDCQWHLFRIQWDAVRQQMDVSMDNILRLTLNKDLVDDIFGGDPEVYWGFAGSTGGYSNLQQFCAALRPAFNFDGGQIFCDGTPIQFKDYSSSFGAITHWWWDLGDGSFSVDPQPPAHLYPSAGHYQVKLVIADNSGCISDTLKAPFTVGAYPVARFTPDVLCLGGGMTMSDQTSIAVGTLKKWEWDWGDGTTSNSQNPLAPYATTGPRNIRLTVTSEQGCANTVEKSVLVSQIPTINGSGENVCLGSSTHFQGVNLTPATPVASWHWDMDNQATLTGIQPTYQYPDTGHYLVRLYAVSNDGCPSPEINIPVSVTAVYARAGRDTIVASGQPLQLQAQWGDDRLQYTWSPATGLNNPYIPNPVALLHKDQTYRLTLVSPEGCRDEDQINVKVYEGPEFYVPNAFTPNNDGRNDVFRVIAAGIPQLDFFIVWDRWGQEVFRSNSLPGGWDGTCQGHLAPAGTYVWMVQGVDYTGRRFSRKGTVTLIR
ncbi:gliding motility-associated-like protein [Chitinophaga polysaccharea]|uniref:Gliding motility-associated-like protein n=1 Tax=Chitinophaga polysaccharea TaxID=1293035 RepID=A0A561PR57_9BACT|nr:PKD domain-containing protein [Chitinophaga polysaccharea]TWF40573.1 gliding motility-associated-like protein [Chitinophaga polysaccharea]